MKQDESLRKQCQAQAVEGLGECGDRVALYMGYIESQCLVQAVEQDCRDDEAGEAMRMELGKKMFRLARLEQYFAEYAKSRHLTDPIEHRLRFQMDCEAKGLTFPVAYTNALYTGMAAVPDSVVDSAVQRVRKDESDIGTLAAYFVNEMHPFWRSYLERRYADQFDAAGVEERNDLLALGKLEMDEADVDYEWSPEQLSAIEGKDALYFHTKYPEISSHGPAPTLNQTQRAQLRDLITDAGKRARRHLAIDLTERILAPNDTP